MTLMAQLIPKFLDQSATFSANARGDSICSRGKLEEDVEVFYSSGLVIVTDGFVAEAVAYAAFSPRTEDLSSLWLAYLFRFR